MKFRWIIVEAFSFHELPWFLALNAILAMILNTSSGIWETDVVEKEVFLVAFRANSISIFDTLIIDSLALVIVIYEESFLASQTL